MHSAAIVVVITVVIDLRRRLSQGYEILLNLEAGDFQSLIPIGISLDARGTV
jgi:hypothetical protein